MNKRGLFITLEGPEGSGKSTQLRRLVRWLKGQGRTVVALRDPGSTAVGRATRAVLLHTACPLSPMAEALLFIGGRVQLVEELIEPALRRGRTVVCDRFHDATVAYQGFGGGLDVGWLNRLGRHAIGGRMPDLTILLDVPPRISFTRLARARDRIERKTRLFHERVYRGYRQLARTEPRRFMVVDAAAPAEQVWRAMQHALKQRIRGHS
jgi:dTMP kinase